MSQSDPDVHLMLGSGRSPVWLFKVRRHHSFDLLRFKVSNKTSLPDRKILMERWSKLETEGI